MKIVIIGASGRLGAALAHAYRDKFDVVAFNRAQLDLARADEIERQVEPLNFDVLINAAAFTDVDRSEAERDLAFAINAEAPRILAQICRTKKAKLIHFSTDYVFSGAKQEPYDEEDVAEPISVYGESKREGEENVLAVNDRHLVIRVSWVFGPERPSFVDQMIKRAMEQEQIAAVSDKFSTPTYTRDVATMLPRFFDAGVGGLLHFANTGQCSWMEYAQYALDCGREHGLSLKAKSVAPLKLKELKAFVARRPPYTVLSTARFTELVGSPPRPWSEAVAEYVREFYAPKRAS